MNFLAHLYLSGDSSELLIGNFIADAVKGKEYQKFSEGIIQGIRLHRKIDEFTDRHPVVHQSVERLRPVYSKYSTVIVDIFYDHFLACNWNSYSEIPLDMYAQDIYKLITSRLDIMPLRVHRFLPYMIEGNWLYNYSNMEGIERVLRGMSGRAKFVSHMENSIEDLRRDYALYEAEFKLFFPDLIRFSEAERRA
ncbi:MAG: ACP phosphodiesterase [Cytophagaceae bacterium]